MISAIFICTTAILGYISINLFIKIEKVGDALDDVTQDLESTLQSIDNTYSEMVTIDSKGAFQSDDEVGSVFTTLKEVVHELNDKYSDKEELNGR